MSPVLWKVRLAYLGRIVGRAGPRWHVLLCYCGVEGFHGLRLP